jgi:hypothetical protein
MIVNFQASKDGITSTIIQSAADGTPIRRKLMIRMLQEE